MNKQVKETQSAVIMDEVYFLMCASKMKRDTGNDIETVGLSSTFGNITISCYGELDSNHELIIEDFGEMRKGKWVQMQPTESQIDALKALLSSEVEKVNQVKSDQEREQSEQLQHERDYYKYGQEGALYSKFH